MLKLQLNQYDLNPKFLSLILSHMKIRHLVNRKARTVLTVLLLDLCTLIKISHKRKQPLLL